MKQHFSLVSLFNSKLLPHLAANSLSSLTTTASGGSGGNSNGLSRASSGGLTKRPGLGGSLHPVDEEIGTLVLQVGGKDAAAWWMGASCRALSQRKMSI